MSSGSVFGPLTDALIVRDVSLAAPVNLTGATVDKGGVHYEAALNGAGGTLASVSLGSVGRTFNVENSTTTPADLTVSGAVIGTVPLTKTGAGTVLLNGPVDGSATVVAGALGGTGTIAGAVDVGAAGTLTPGGASIGTLSTGPLTFGLNSTYALDINFVNRSSDKVNVNGAIVLSTNISNPTVLSITDLNPIGQFTFFVLPIVDYSTWNGGLFSYNGVIIDDYDPANPSASTKFFVGPNRYAIDYDYNNGHTIALRSIPEPGSLALAFGGVVLLGSRSFRRASLRR